MSLLDRGGLLIVASMNEAVDFLTALAGDSLVTFQTFDDSPAKQKSLSRIQQGVIASREESLRKLNERGAGVYCMVNQGDGKGRKTENVRSVRALFVDLDGSPLEPVLKAPIKPHITCESSPGRFHAYWLVNNFPLDDFKHFQHHLAGMYNADPKVCDLPRVMRLPGFLHCKDDPVMSRLLSVSDGPRISRDTIAEAFGISAPIRNGERNNKLFQQASRMKHAGIPKTGAKKRLEVINTDRCVNPVDESELERLLQSAYAYQSETFSMVPHDLIDNDMDDLSTVASKLLMYAMRRQRPGDTFSLIWSDYSHIKGFTKRQTFNSAKEELQAIGLLEMVQNYIASTEKEERQPAMYRITGRGTNSTP